MFGRDRGGIDPVTLDDRRKEMVVLDVRDPYEWQAGHIDGAVLVPLSALAGKVGTIDRGRPVAVVCRSGNRSRAAVRFLKANGVDAHNVSGGMVAWSTHRLPTVTDRGRPGTVA
ncbi:MAG: rhodanese-like domain-containing protein [Actinomycetota bacterium]